MPKKERPSRDELKKKHGKHLPYVDSVTAAMDGAGTKPKNRVRAGLKQTIANTRLAINEGAPTSVIVEALNHLDNNVEGWVEEAFRHVDQ